MYFEKLRVNFQDSTFFYSGSVMKPMFAVTKFIPPVKNDTATKFTQPVKNDTTMETTNLYDRDWNIQTERTQFGTVVYCRVPL